MINFYFWRALIALLFLSSQHVFSASPPAPKIDLAVGKRLYLSNCISCHHKDPNLKGSLGPEIKNVPFTVLQTKVMTGKYPTNLPKDFIPKRKTKLMKAMPKLEKDIASIHAWIISMNKK